MSHLVWAAYDAGDVAPDGHVLHLGRLHYLLKPLQALVDAAVDVLLAECLGRSTKDGDLIDAGLQRMLKPLRMFGGAIASRMLSFDHDRKGTKRFLKGWYG